MPFLSMRDTAGERYFQRQLRPTSQPTVVAQPQGSRNELTEEDLLYSTPRGQPFYPSASLGAWFDKPKYARGRAYAPAYQRMMELRERRRLMALSSQKTVPEGYGQSGWFKKIGKNIQANMLKVSGGKSQKYKSIWGSAGYATVPRDPYQRRYRRPEGVVDRWRELKRNEEEARKAAYRLKYPRQRRWWATPEQGATGPTWFEKIMAAIREGREKQMAVAATQPAAAVVAQVEQAAVVSAIAPAAATQSAASIAAGLPPAGAGMKWTRVLKGTGKYQWVQTYA